MEQKLVQKSTVYVHTYLPGAGADPGFHQHTIFLKNCMKLRKFWPVGGDASLDPPLGRYGVLFLKHEIENNFVLAGDWGERGMRVRWGQI